ncbi:DUF695 domain-containing protein [Spongiactinospora sp. TRM90649]|uniref:DUF695 domain-containing protein n=1 Tax=Spongiactinospora sp. TRM90649 TaxID=3031114 RepID=UPI0023F83585|nr:DUF695 domain-containing protein [Spongiactinospora sp. TRM90649]MDF5753410.1 DUF695 domain-containing protein [Spongiactinospora sp. TRM90649]
MRLFGRKGEESESGSDRSKAIGEFWDWWHAARPELDALLVAGDSEKLAERIAPAVTAVHPGLVWEIAPGRHAEQALVVTAAGDPEVRPVAHRWARAAPKPDERWEFHPSRQANPEAAGLSVDVGGYEFDFDKLTMGLHVPRGKPRVDVTAYHPIFTLLDEETRLEATLLALDWLLGEDDVARWVGEIRPAAFQPIDAVAAVHLPSVVADVAAEFDEEQWALMEGRTADGAKLIATVRYPLRQVDHPLFDRHVAIGLPYAHRDADGLPEGESLAALRGFEERLAEALAERPAVVAAHVTAGGQREVHIYTDSESDVAERAGELVSSWKEGTAEIEVDDDPGWAAVAPFLS